MTAFRAGSTKKAVETLVTAAAEWANAHDCTIQLFDPDFVASSRHLSAAWEHAQASWKNKNDARSATRAIAHSLSSELLLWVACTPKMDVAIPRAGAKKTDDFLVFCSRALSAREKNELLEALDATEKKPDAREKTIEKGAQGTGGLGKLGAKTASALGISNAALSAYSLDDLVLEKMAVSRILND